MSLNSSTSKGAVSATTNKIKTTTGMMNKKGKKKSSCKVKKK